MSILVFLFCGPCLGSVIISPPDLAGSMHTVTLSYIDGLSPNTNLTAEAVVALSRNCNDSQFNSSQFKGKIVVLKSNTKSISVLEQYGSAACFHNAGAVAVISTCGPLFSTPGVSYYWKYSGMNHNVRIPVLQGVDSDVNRVIEALEDHQQVIIHVSADPNLWRSE